MKAEELVRHFRDREAGVRSGNGKVLASMQGRRTTVGKHEARNYAHLEAVLTEADAACPRAADTIRWLLWHEVLNAQWYTQMAEMLVDTRER